MLSTFFPMAIISIATIGSFLAIGGMENYTLGVYGISIAAIGMLSTVGMIVAVDAYGPISDNAGGIAQMANLDKEVRERTDRLDSVGNTTAAIGKGFAIGSAALTSLALFMRLCYSYRPFRYGYFKSVCNFRIIIRCFTAVFILLSYNGCSRTRSKQNGERSKTPV